MGNVLIEESTMSSIADSIRGKTGGSEPMKPREMPAEIDSISTGSNKPDPSLPVRFFSYDGELLYSFSLEQLAELDNLPPVPDMPGLVSQGWNWTLSELRQNAGDADVGPMYITDDGATRIHISLPGDRLTPVLGFFQSEASGVTVDWGDGSPAERGSAAGSSPVNLSHTYENSGSYIISILPDDEVTVSIKGSGSGLNIVSGLIYSNSNNSDQHAAYRLSVDKIELGKNVEIFDGAFSRLSAMKSITVPAHIQSMGTFVFSSDSSLKTIVLPRGLTAIKDAFANECSSMQVVCVPYSVTTLGMSVFYSNYQMDKITLPNTVTLINEAPFTKCTALRSFHFPDSVTAVAKNMFSNNTVLEKVDYGNAAIQSIGASAFVNCSRLDTVIVPSTVTTIGRSMISNCPVKSIYLYPETPPALADPNSFVSLSSLPDLVIYVPHGHLADYQNDQNWSQYVSKMQEMPE